MRAKIKRIWKVILEELALFSLEFIIVIAIAATCIFIFLEIAEYIQSPFVEQFDNKMIGIIRANPSSEMDAFMRGASFLNNPEFIIFPIFGVLIYFLFIKPHRWFSIKIPVVAVGAQSINWLLKNYFERPRPEALERMVVARDYSFPSGHAMFSIAFYGLLIYIISHYTKGTIRVLLIILILTIIFFIGVSRVYLRVHYPTDVIAGYIMGLMWLLISVGTIRFMERKIKKNIKQIDEAVSKVVE